MLAGWSAKSWVFAKYPAGDWQPQGMTFEDAWFSSADGTKLHGWYVRHPQPRAVVLYAHGAARNVTTRAPALKRLHQMGMSALTFDYRGYGRSDGSPDAVGIVRDGHAARQWLAAAEGIDASQIVLLGHSLGTAVTVAVAAETAARGVILLSPLSSIQDFLAVNWWIPTWLLRGYEMNSVAAIGRYAGPLLMVVGARDGLTPPALGQKLFAAANEPKRLVSSPGGHDDFTDEMYQAIDEFIAGLK